MAVSVELGLEPDACDFAALCSSAAGVEPAVRARQFLLTWSPLLSTLPDHVTGTWSVLTKRRNLNWSQRSASLDIII